MGLCEAQQHALVVVFTLGGERGVLESAQLGCWDSGSSQLWNGGGAKQPCSQQSETFPGTRTACLAHILMVEASGADQCPLFAVWMCLECDWTLYMGVV